VFFFFQIDQQIYIGRQCLAHSRGRWTQADGHLQQTVCQSEMFTHLISHPTLSTKRSLTRKPRSTCRIESSYWSRINGALYSIDSNSILLGRRPLEFLDSASKLMRQVAEVTYRERMTALINKRHYGVPYGNPAYLYEGWKLSPRNIVYHLMRSDFGEVPAFEFWPIDWKHKGIGVSEPGVGQPEWDLREWVWHAEWPDQVPQ